MRKNVILTDKQQANINQLFKQAKFDRLVKGLLSDKTTNADTKSKLVYALKKKIFDEVPTRKSRF
jgi:hypothetical protein